ncbi:response regulator transcription factor [Parapedobacter indicus]|uniref:DNA-binding response regulator, OmpR family, contains REC and winged-helix (WHTH) domain n=1 Tax=Parapedobacter indicus TaxID=1477437 RepID=A0A1I3NEA1_9SPHI|nr:response regulator [Parapedobacter indicus]PPL00960.1 DNA-binding response OmpR family regulator [Parapedobacter indicus]SFJ07532.1 DNA-binding response regulator, OmpR family, contains REC and winged-helix (wHTH) domain [Parapedobacter indicus]
MEWIPQQTKRPTLLVVDDHVEILDFIADDLSDDYDVLRAEDGYQAIEALADHSVHLVVSDVMMPGMDGYELCSRIKSDVQYSHIPVILLTAKNTLQSKIQGLEQGADAYIEKPFSPEHLHAQINSLLSNRNKVREYFASSPLAHINTMAHSKADEHFLERLNELIHECMAEPNFDVEHLADKMNMSRPTLYRKIKAISDLTPNDLINVARLKKAAELLALGGHKIYEVSDLVGYSSQTHFGRNFQKQFGMSPSEYVIKSKK